MYPKQSKNQLFLGNFVHSKSLGELEILHNAAVCVDSTGTILTVERDCNQQKALEIVCAGLGWDLEDVAITVARDGRQFFFPGFIDTHVHAPQYPNVGIFGKSTLLDWLNKYTFPMEASMTDLAKARRVYTRCIRRMLANGTTTAAYFATRDVAATNLLADLCHAMGQRALVGRVCMDHLAPEYYIDASAEQAITDTLLTIEHMRALSPSFDLVTPILTPRFAPSCTSALLTRIAALHAETGLPIQTHISENTAEIALVKSLFPDHKTYADVYDAHGLLTDKTILAHAIHLSESEADLLAARGCKVAHCPCSNAALTSGVARVRRLLDKGVHVGLGTDMSGGYSPSVLEAARQAKLASNQLVVPGGLLCPVKTSDDNNDPLTTEEEQEKEKERDRAVLSVDEVLYLATRGGAHVVGLADKIGAFEVGMRWDAQLVDLGPTVPDELTLDPDLEGSSRSKESGVGGGSGVVEDGNVDIFGWETWDERVAKWVFNGDDRNTKKVWVQGRLVHERA
ncbi:guanine deaminase [Xylariaceae sp. FL0594]|nr:guanine deaminase [Xylariaceae sp. FL0594]